MYCGGAVPKPPFSIYALICTDADTLIFGISAAARNDNVSHLLFSSITMKLAGNTEISYLLHVIADYQRFEKGQ